MPRSTKRGSGHANHRNREAETLASQGRYVLLASHKPPVIYGFVQRENVYRSDGGRVTSRPHFV